MTKVCLDCENIIDYKKYYCQECSEEIGGIKPIKSKALCDNCMSNYNNISEAISCRFYDNAKIIIKDQYLSLKDANNLVTPTPMWKLNCFVREFDQVGEYSGR